MAEKIEDDLQARDILRNTGRGLLLLVAGFILNQWQPNAAFALDEQININTATVKELERLPFIGETKARAIVEYRQQHGPYATIEDVRHSTSIGESTFKAIKPYIILSGNSTFHEPQPQSPGKDDNTTYILKRIRTSPDQIILLPDATYYQTLISFIESAQSSIDIVMFVFKATQSPGNRALLLLKALIEAQHRGVKVSILLEQSDYDQGLNEENKKTAALLQKENITVSFDSRQRTTHTKTVVIDSRFCFIGSHNLTHSALRYNHELSLLIDSQALADEILSYIRALPLNR